MQSLRKRAELLQIESTITAQKRKNINQIDQLPVTKKIKHILNIFDLPIEIYYCVFEHLDVNSILQIRQLSHYFKKIIDDNLTCNCFK